MKEEMESLEVRAVLRELRCLEGGHLKKIYQPDEGEILFRIYMSGEENKMLLFKIGKALYLTRMDRKNPMEPGDYVMLMRKYTGNAKIMGIEQHGLDRVVSLDLQKRRKSRLIFEIFGKGNLILEGEEHILVPYRSESWSHRKLKEGHTYKYPPSRVDPFELDRSSFEKILKESEKDLVRTLAVDLNLGGKYAEEICYRLGVDKNMKNPQGSLGELYSEIQRLRRQTEDEELDPHVIMDEDGDIIDAVPFPLTRYEELESKRVESYNHALDLAFQEEESKEEKEDGAEASRLERKLASQQRAVSDLKEKESENQLKAELIYQNYPRCEELLKEVKRAREEGNRDEVYSKLLDDQDVLELNDSDEYLVVELEGNVDGDRCSENVKLDFRKDVNENAQHHYNKSKECKKKIEGAKEAIKETKKEIEEGNEKRAREKEDKKATAKYWFDRYKWFISSEGHMVIAGKDTKTNEEVVKKYLEKYDRYAHAEAGGAPSVVIKKGDKKEIGEKTLREACQYAIIHSKEWKRGIAAGRAYWVKPEQVSKTAEAGESLPTGAFVIRGKRNYMGDLRMEAVLVETEYKGKKKIMCAPSSTVEEAESDDFVKKVNFIPGKKDLNGFAKEMSDHFRVPVEDILKILPPGDVDVIKKES